MLDNQTRMRSMLDLLETVDHGKKIRLNESIEINESDDRLVQDIAEEALNVAIRHIQDDLGVTTGDLAGMFFSGDSFDTIKNVFVEYIQAELEDRVLDEYQDDTTMTR